MEYVFLNNADMLKIINERKGLFDLHKEVEAKYGSKYIGSIGNKHYIEASVTNKP